MDNIKEKVNTIDQYQQQINLLIEDLKDTIYSNIQTKNKYIKQISDSPSIFILNSKHLSSDSWSPVYYDYKHQVRLIKEKISKYNNLDSIRKILSETIETGKIDQKTIRAERINPYIIDQLQVIYQNL